MLKTSDRKVQQPLYLTPTQRDFIKAKALEAGKPLSHLVCEIVFAHYSKEQEPKRQRVKVAR